MQNQPELLEQFPYSTDAQWFNALQFVRKAPFAENFWQIFKGLYKKVESYVQTHPENCTGSMQKLVIAFLDRIDAVTPEHIQNERFPTIPTLGYMKRRARRLLNSFGKIDADIYMALAKGLLTAQEDKTSILPAQWLCLDLFWGNSRRHEQTGFGHNDYHLFKERFQFKKPEERFSEIWENNPQVLYDLLQKNIPVQVSAFAVQILERKQLNLPALSDQKIIDFFNSGFATLQRVAVKIAYQKMTFQNISPALYAGLWLFAPADLQIKIADILKKRPVLDKTWDNDFAEKLTNTTWNLLEKGNKSRRIIKALMFLNTQYPTKLKQLNTLAIAPALFQSKHDILNKLALASVQNAKKEDAVTWISALGERNAHSDALYEKVKITLAGKFSNSINKNIVTPFIFHENYFVADFGWHLTEKMQEWALYQLWSKFTQGSFLYGKRRTTFMHAITAPSGIKSFQRYYKHSSYFIGNFQGVTLNFVLENADKNIVSLFKNYYKDQFQNNPLATLQKISSLPAYLRDEILQISLPLFKNKDVITHSWYIRYVFQQAQTDVWLFDAMRLLIENSKFTLQSAYNILEAILNNHYNHLPELFSFLESLSQGRQDKLLETVAQNPHWLVSNATFFSATWRNRALENLNIEAVVNIIRNAESSQWEVLKESVYVFLMKNPQPSSFWIDVLETAIAMPDSPLVVRILENETCKNLFLQLQDATILDIAQPELEDLLSEWACANPSLFVMGSYDLFRLCIHKLPKLRTAGYALAKKHGITLVFALRLMESDLPEAVGEAQAFFNALPTQSDAEWDALLGMIDSPNRQVRIFALAYWKERAEYLGTRPQLLPFLSEHADQSVQEAVAQEIKEKKVQNPFVQRFEKEVLRQKNTARKAKNIVKAHIEETLEVDAQTLIELAQSANKREAEWAIVQLTKKALAGEDTAGFVLQ